MLRPSPLPLPNSLGGEKRFERAARNFGRHAGAHVRHRDRHVITGDDAFVAVIEWLVEHGIRGRDRQAPAACHRIPRVDGQVEQRVLQLRRIDQAAPQHRVLRDFDLDGFAERPLQDRRHPADQLVHVGDLRPQRLLAGESEQAAVEIGDPLGRLDRPFGQAAAGDLGGRQCVEQQIEIAERRRQHVVGVVRDPSGQLPDGFDLLCLTQFVLDALALSDVDRQHEIAAHRAVMAAIGHPDGLAPAFTAVGKRRLLLAAVVRPASAASIFSRHSPSRKGSMKSSILRVRMAPADGWAYHSSATRLA